MQVSLVEEGVRLLLTVVDTPGYGESVDNTDCWAAVLEYVELQLEARLEGEQKVLRDPGPPDTAAHACIFFLPPTSHGLRNIDIICMQRLQRRVNLIPVVAKADSLTQSELAALRAQVRRQMAEHNISAYQVTWQYAGLGSYLKI